MKIGQLANIVGCTVEAVRFYEKQGFNEYFIAT
jgi:DNA-binding transcriptional MerR regulator